MTGILLFIEDDDSLRRIFVRKFELMGLKVHSFESRDTGLAWLNDNRNKATGEIDLDWIISDVDMTGMSAFDFIHEIKQLGFSNLLTFMSGNPHSHNSQEIERLGFIVIEKNTLLLGGNFFVQ